MTLPPTKQASFATLCQIDRKKSSFDEDLLLESNVCSYSPTQTQAMGSDPFCRPRRLLRASKPCKLNDLEPRGSDPFLKKGVRPLWWSDWLRFGGARWEVFPAISDQAVIAATTLGSVKPLGFVPDFIDEDPGTFHHRAVEVEDRALWVPTLGPTRVLILGSSQNDEDLDRQTLEQRQIEVARRRSGGGAVLVSEDDLVWFDVVIAKTDPLWVDDVSRSFDWLGEAVSRAMASLGVETSVHHGPLVQNNWSRRVCFAGLGPGELTVGGRKVVGMSQRRTRDWARFQVAVLRSWNGVDHRSFFRVAGDEEADADDFLSNAAAPVDGSPGDILAAVIEALADY